jgi:acetate kinase
VFSGGIGEHDAVLRTQVGEQLAWLGVAVDPVLNGQATGDRMLAIHRADSDVQVWVVPTDEGRVTAREAARLTVKSKAPG